MSRAINVGGRQGRDPQPAPVRTEPDRLAHLLAAHIWQATPTVRLSQRGAYLNHVALIVQNHVRRRLGARA